LTKDAGPQAVAGLAKSWRFSVLVIWVGTGGGKSVLESLQSTEENWYQWYHVWTHWRLWIGKDRMNTQLGEVYLSDLGLEDDGMIVIAETFANGATNLRVPDLELRKS
jgi:hypothetical protein